MQNKERDNLVHLREKRGTRLSIRSEKWWADEYLQGGWKEDEDFERRYPQHTGPSIKPVWGAESILSGSILDRGVQPYSK